MPCVSMLASSTTYSPRRSQTFGRWEGGGCDQSKVYGAGERVGITGLRVAYSSNGGVGGGGGFGSRMSLSARPHVIIFFLQL